MENLIEMAEKNIKSAEQALVKAREQLAEAKGDKGLIAKFSDLVLKNGWRINEDSPDYLPRVDAQFLKIKLPNANRQWSCAILKSVVEFCNMGYGWPVFYLDSRPSNEIWIKLED